MLISSNFVSQTRWSIFALGPKCIKPPWLVSSFSFSVLWAMMDEVCSSSFVLKEPLNPQIFIETHLHQTSFSVSSRPIVCSSPQTPRVFPFLFNSRPLLCLIFPFLLCPQRTRKQNPSDTNFIILQNPSMFREIGKKTLKHKQKQNRAPEQKLWNTNTEI